VYFAAGLALINATHLVRSRPVIRATNRLAAAHAQARASHGTIPRMRYGQGGVAKHSTAPCTLHRS
jgi:HAMP domain-containing protein